ncbi:hypothetical protein RB200_19525 [Streptomyces sp. PmtG]
MDGTFRYASLRKSRDECEATLTESDVIVTLALYGAGPVRPDEEPTP